MARQDFENLKFVCDSKIMKLTATEKKQDKVEACARSLLNEMTRGREAAAGLSETNCVLWCRNCPTSRFDFSSLLYALVARFYR